MTEPTSDPVASAPATQSPATPSAQPAPQPPAAPDYPPSWAPPRPDVPYGGSAGPAGLGHADGAGPGGPGGPGHAGSSGWGGGTVSRGLIAVLAPVLAVVMFATGVFAERTLFSPGGAPIGPSATATADPGTSPRPSDAATELQLVEQAWNDIQDNYVDAQGLDNQALAYGAIRGMVDAVGDEGHTIFMTAEEAKAQEQSLSGTFVGIGVQVDEKDGWATIISIFPKTPAEEAGIQRGDQIKAVDGVSMEGKTLDEVVSKVRGPEGEKVTLTIGRAGTQDLTITITRRKFDLPLVSWAMVPGRKVAVIRLDQFSTGATKAVQGAITAAKEAGATALIFDLRGNPGGYVNEAIGVASQFVGDGNVYTSFDRGGKKKDEPVEAGGLATDIPLVVLADAGTASSGEIVTGCIQDAGRAKVVGTKTFGTGTVLGAFDLADGSVLRIGVERWLTRAGRPIWHEGLEPDVKVELPADVAPLTPDQLRDMSAAEVAATKDAQVLKALELLVGKG